MWYPVDETGECLRIGPYNDAPFEEISCLYPMLGKTYTAFEFSSGITPVHQRMLDTIDDNPWIPVVACAIYFAAITLGQRYFKSRPAWDCRRVMAAWNLGLALFSLRGFMITATQLAHNLYYYGFHDTINGDPLSMLGAGSSTHWVFCFILSKFVELFDTFFIVVHKKKLMFLHWYHHITVLLFCWYSWVNEQSMGIIFCAVNFGVHSIMYFYYFLMAVKCKPKWFNPQVRIPATSSFFCLCFV